MITIFRLWLIALVTTALFGCSGVLSNGHRWGEDVTLAPGWKKVGESAWNALKSPEVWVPAVGALTMQIDHYDERVSDWALKHHPIFKDEKEANDAGNDLRATCYIAYGLSVLTTPGGSLDSQWAMSKAKGLSVGLAAYGLTHYTTDIFKDTTNRERPDNSDDRSFFSGHASQSAVYAILADRNIRVMDLPRWAKISSKVGLTALPLATGWARVEAAKHFPGDILTGIAVGHFFGILINDAFMGIDQDAFQLTIEPGRESLYAGFRVRY